MKIAAATGAQSTVPFPGLSSLLGPALDHRGTLYVADAFDNRVLRLRPNGTQAVLNPTGLNTPTGLAFPPRTGADG
ncbi:hypothetical protein AB0F11_36740 [Streptomyces sp. NPDC032472]|uniref:hypothetical protein n=1 Tax=Streptomyces sp. NPDC032472 TaxID=3155018 RepID=UPI00340B8B8B